MIYFITLSSCDVIVSASIKPCSMIGACKQYISICMVARAFQYILSFYPTRETAQRLVSQATNVHSITKVSIVCYKQVNNLSEIQLNVLKLLHLHEKVTVAAYSHCSIRNLTFPSSLSECENVSLFLLDNAQAYGIDRRRVAIAGNVSFCQLL